MSCHHFKIEFLANTSYTFIFRLAPNIWNAMKGYLFDRLNEALLMMINEELAKCDIIAIIAGDCDDSRGKSLLEL